MSPKRDSHGTWIVALASFAVWIVGHIYMNLQNTSFIYVAFLLSSVMVSSYNGFMGKQRNVKAGRTTPGSFRRRKRPSALASEGE